jgi:hypothetical protein
VDTFADFAGTDFDAARIADEPALFITWRVCFSHTLIAVYKVLMCVGGLGFRRGRAAVLGEGALPSFGLKFETVISGLGQR